MLRAHLPLWIVAALAWAPPAGADDLPLFRLFLRDGTTIACLGEFARVGSRVVFALPLTPDAAETRLVSLDEARVDWTRTERYAESQRSLRYAETRGETDFALLSGEVARVLNEIALTESPAQRLALAEHARQRLAEWPPEHYNYRAADVQQIVQLVDEAISELRAASGEERFELAFVANVAPPAPEAMLPPPTAEEMVTTALAVAERADQPAERLSLLDALAGVVDRVAATLPPAVGGRLRGLVTSRFRTEQKVEANYSRLAAGATARARAGAAAADVRAVQRVIASVHERDERLGRQRPQRVSALLLALQEQLDAARRLRLARDRYTLRVKTYRAYRDSIARSLRTMDRLAPGLDDIKRLAGPAATELASLADGAARVIRDLGAVVPPPELAPAHTLLLSAAQLAAQAAATREQAVRSGEMDGAWRASSAAAGSLMLLARGRADLERALVPPQLP